jgi:hypothetical protein
MASERDIFLNAQCQFLNAQCPTEVKEVILGYIPKALNKIHLGELRDTTRYPEINQKNREDYYQKSKQVHIYVDGLLKLLSSKMCRFGFDHPCLYIAYLLIFPLTHFLLCIGKKRKWRDISIKYMTVINTGICLVTFVVALVTLTQWVYYIIIYIIDFQHQQKGYHHLMCQMIYNVFTILHLNVTDVIIKKLLKDL